MTGPESSPSSPVGPEVVHRTGDPSSTVTMTVTAASRMGLSAIVRAAEQGQTTILTRRGKPLAVVLPIEDYARLLEAEDRHAFLLRFPGIPGFQR